MSPVDFDAIASVITPEQLARAIGAKRASSGNDFHCPGPAHKHGDRKPSLSINRENGRTVAFCHGCGLSGTPVQVASELWGITEADAAQRLVWEAGLAIPPVSGADARGPGSPLGEMVATYEYTDEEGGYLFEVVRYAHPKDFRQRVRGGDGSYEWSTKGVRRVLYRLPEVRAAVKAEEWLFIVEGEKDADRLASMGFVATTCPSGAGKWRDEYSRYMAGARVCLLPDNDDQGRRHAQEVAQALHGIASEVRVLELPDLPEKGDVSVWLEGGGTDDELKALVRDAPMWEPKAGGEAPTTAHTASNDEDEEHHRTDLGNAERLVQLHGDRIRHVREWGTWLVWDGMRWAKDRTGEVERLAQATVREMHKEAFNLLEGGNSALRADLSKHAFASEREARIKSMVSLGRVMEGVPLLPEALDADPWLFNVLNGTIDLKTGELQKHDPNDLITKLAPVEYDSSATAERFERFLLEIMDERTDLVSFLKRCVGYSMTGSTTEHVLLFLHGVGANGKTTLLNVFLRLFGDYGQQSEPDLLLRKRSDAHPTGVARLHGARLVATSEIDAGRHMAEALVKSLTGGDRITARFMKTNFFEFEPTHTLWLAANHKPVIRGTDTAIWRRIKLIPFDVSIPVKDQDPDLAKTLEGELPGILKWAVEGCLEWKSEGLNAPAEVTTATQSYRDDMDVLGEFMDEHCIIEDGAEVECKILYEKYGAWTETAGERKLSQKQFGQRLQDRGFEKQKHSRTRRVIYLGIRINTPCEAVRSCNTVPPLKTAHVETIVNTPSHGFAPVEDDDYERIERDANQAESDTLTVGQTCAAGCGQPVGRMGVTCARCRYSSTTEPPLNDLTTDHLPGVTPSTKDGLPAPSERA